MTDAEVIIPVIYGLVDNATMELHYVGKTIVLECNPADLNEAERRWIREMRGRGARLLNIADGGEGGGFMGPHTPETRTKISIAMLGHKCTLETRARISAAWIGRLVSEETRAKMSAAHMGKQYALGYKQTPGHRAKISAALIGHPVSEKTREKISATNMSHFVSKETRQKISDSHKKRGKELR